MERRMIPVKVLLAGPAILLAAMAVGSCSNPIDLSREVQTEVMVARNMFLKVQGSTPAHQASEVIPGQPMTIQFDRALDTATISASTIQLTPSVPWTFKFNPATHVLSITAALEGLTDYTVTITPGVKASDGSGLQNPVSWSFGTKQAPSGTITVTGLTSGFSNSTTVTLAITKNTEVQYVRFAESSAIGSGAGEFRLDGQDWIDVSPPPESGYTYTFQDTGDGPKTVFAQFQGATAADVTNSELIYSEVTLDRTGPSSAISVAAGADWTTTATVGLTLTGSDGTGSGITQMQFSNNASTWSSLEAWSTSKAAWALSTGDGSKTVYMRAVDAVGNTTTVSDAVGLDTAAPTITSFTAEDGDPYTNVTAVSTTQAATDGGSGLASMQFCVDGYKGWTTWSAWSTTRESVSMSTTDGVKTVRIQVKDVAGNIAAASDTITLDRTGPAISSFAVAGGTAAVNTTTVSLGQAASDAGSGLFQMQFSNNGTAWSTAEAWNTAKAGWSMTSGDGTKTVYLRVTDNLGNASTLTDTIVLDTMAPTVSVFTVGSGNPSSTNTTSVTLYLTAADTGGSGVTQMRYANDAAPTGAYETYAGTKAWTLTNTKGTRTVYAHVRDAAGNVREVTDAVTLNARIVITFTRVLITEDGDTDILFALAGEIYFRFYVDGVLTFSQTTPISITSPDMIALNVPVTVYHNPGTSLVLTGQLFDDDGSADDASNVLTVTHSSPFVDVAETAHGITGVPEGAIYYAIDVQN